MSNGGTWSSQAGKWLGLVTAVWVQSTSGNNYTFSNYSHAIKTLMGLTQLELNNLSVAKDVGKAFGILAGLASDTLPTPVILLIGSVEGLVGYGMQWLVVSRTIKPLPYWQMCIFLCMGGNSTTWMNTAVLVTCIRNFRRNRGPVSGILKGYIGLSTAIFTDLCSALFSNSPSSFLLMLSLIPFLVCLSAMFFLHETPTVPHQGDDEQQGENRYFGIFNVVALVIAVYLLTFDTLGRRTDLSISVRRIFVVLLLLLLMAPLGVPIYIWVKTVKREERGEGSEPLMLQQGNERLEVKEEVEDKKEKENGGGRRSGVLQIGDEHTVLEAVVTWEFWVLFGSFLCGVGTGMMVQNNMGQMGTAMGYDDVSTFVSLLSIFGFFGRLGSGIISEYFLKESGVPRPMWNAISQIPMAIGYVVMALGLPGSLYICSVVVGLCYGIRLAITVPTASELFGLKYYGLIYNILILNLPLGSFLFSGLLAGILYDAEATRIPGGGNYCVGAHCYRLVFFIMASVCMLGFLLDILLASRTKGLYKKISQSKECPRRDTTPRVRN